MSLESFRAILLTNMFCPAGDCWELGRQSYNNGDHYHTVLWMAEALNKFEDESNKTVAREDILDYLAFSTYKQGVTNTCMLMN